MKRTTVIRVAALAVLAGVTTALPATSFGEVIFQDNFENVDLNQSLHWYAPQVGPAAQLAWDGSGYAANQTTAAGFPNPAANGGTKYADPWYKTVAHLGSEHTNQVVTYDFDMYVKGNANAANNIGLEFMSFDQASTYKGRAFDVIFQQKGTLSQYDGSNFNQIPSGTFSFATDQWVHTKIVADYATKLMSITVGSSTTPSYAFSTDGDPYNNSVADTEFLDTLRSGSGSSNLGDTIAFIDNYTVTVPEPASLGLIALAGGLMLGVRRRKAS